MLTMLAIRSMAKARYTTRISVTTALASIAIRTSPRLFAATPDLMVHRPPHALSHRGQALGRCRCAGGSVTMPRDGECGSHAELLDRAQAGRVHDPPPHRAGAFTGVITGLADWGFYVELEENSAKGWVPARDLRRLLRL